MKKAPMKHKGFLPTTTKQRGNSCLKEKYSFLRLSVNSISTYQAAFFDQETKKGAQRTPKSIK